MALLCHARFRQRARPRQHGIDTEIIDLRTLNPYDWEAIAESVKKTSA